LDFLVYGGQLLVPPLAVGFVAGAVVDRRPSRAASALAALGIMGLGLAYDALHDDCSDHGRPLARRARATRAVGVVAFEGLWLLVVPSALWRLASRRGAVRFAKTPHRPDRSRSRA
jgi:hypothetical protein